jgi:hypothetical protein
MTCSIFTTRGIRSIIHDIDMTNVCTQEAIGPRAAGSSSPGGESLEAVRARIHVVCLDS